MFASPIRDISSKVWPQSGISCDDHDQGLAEQGIAISQTLIETLHQTFGMDGTNHPLFTALGIEEELYEKLVDIATAARGQGRSGLSRGRVCAAVDGALCLYRRTDRTRLSGKL